MPLFQPHKKIPMTHGKEPYEKYHNNMSFDNIMERRYTRLLSKKF